MYLEIPEIKKYTKAEYKNLVGKVIEKALNRKCLIIFFGSINTDRFSRTSDIDVAVYCKEPLSYKDWNKIEEELEKIPILKEIDIVDANKIKNRDFLKNIIEKGKPWKSMPELMKSLKKRLENLEKL